MSPFQKHRTILDAADHSVVWFAMLQRGRRCDDRRLIDRALEELDNLGVRVHFTATNADGVTPTRPAPN